MLASGASSSSVTLTAQKALSSEPPTPTGVSPRHRLHPACWRLHGRGTAHCLGPRAQRSGTGREAGPDAQRPQLGRAGSGQRGACRVSTRSVVFAADPSRPCPRPRRAPVRRLAHSLGLEPKKSDSLSTLMSRFGIRAHTSGFLKVSEAPAAGGSSENG